MRSVLVINSKGGCGKSTLTTNLAGFYACWGVPVALADCDPQGSSMAWLRTRPNHCAPIQGIAAWKTPYIEAGPVEYLFVDAPASVQGELMQRLVALADVILVPVLPSPMDIRASALFIYNLMQLLRHRERPVQVAVVANRVRSNSRAYPALLRFLSKLDIPLVTTLNDSQYYIWTAEQGVSLFELPAGRVKKELSQWQPLVNWLSGDPSLKVVTPVSQLATSKENPGSARRSGDGSGSCAA